MKLLDTLGLIFLVLKFAGLVTWSWWFVLSPYIVLLVIFGIKYMLIGWHEITQARTMQARKRPF